MLTRWNVTPNHDGMGFSNGLSPDENGDFVSFSDYKKLERAYNALAEEMTAAQGQIAEAQTILCKNNDSPWLPFETAPKDGTIFDIWVSADETCGNAPKRIINCKYEGDELQYLYSHRWFSVNGPYSKKTISHWMPQPLPPVFNT